MKVGMLFPGQGAQYVGMGRDLYDRYEVVRILYTEANDALGFDLAALCFDGDEAELTQTRNAQPAILLHSLAVLALLDAQGICPGVVAGHSLGEFTALCAARALQPVDALRIVRRRGELMYQAGLDRPGTMAAVIGLDVEKIEACCRSTDGVVVVANYNSPGQFAISGEPGAVKLASEACREAGARRAVPLPVSGAFHSPLMEAAVEEFAAFLASFHFEDPEVPWVTNVTARVVDEGGAVAGLLSRQLSSPVRWIDGMQVFAGLTGGVALEVGPGKVLAGLMKRCEPGVRVTSVGRAGDFDQLAADA